MEGALAVITARGGSKRIPRKNIKDFCGKPIIAYSIETALKSEMFDEVMVSTDDQEIAEIAMRYGAKVPFLRSKENADDFATTADVLLEVIERYKEMGKEYSYLCCLYPTAPFVLSSSLISAMELLQEDSVQTVMPVVAFSFPPQRGMYMRDGRIEYVYPEYASMRSQDIEKIYHDCGQFYCVKIDAFLKEKKIVMSHTKGILISESEAQDIDTEGDWMIAEEKYQRLNRE